MFKIRLQGFCNTGILLAAVTNIFINYLYKPPARLLYRSPNSPNIDSSNYFPNFL